MNFVSASVAVKPVKKLTKMSSAPAGSEGAQGGDVRARLSGRFAVAVAACMGAGVRV